MLLPLESSSAVLVIMRSKSVSIYNRFHAMPANADQVTISSTSNSKFPHRKLEAVRSFGENPESLSHVCLVWYRDGQAQLL